MPTVRFWLVASLAVLHSGLSAQSFSTENGHVEFTSSVPMHTFTGESDLLVGQINLADSTVDFYVDLTTFETGIGKRDKDMRKTLETDEFPFAEFFGKLTSGFDPATATEQDASVVGNFSIHGVTRTVEISGTLQMADESLKLSAEWKLNLEDYRIVPPSLLIMKVDKMQEIRITAILGAMQ